MKRIPELLTGISPVGFCGSRPMTFVILFFSRQVTNFHKAKFNACAALLIPIPVISIPEH